MLTSGLRLPWRRMRPSRWATSAGRHGASRWCSATARSCTFVPTPIFSVEPISTATLPVRQAANRRPLSRSVFASWMNRIASRGSPRAVSWWRSSS